ncbi:MAG: TlpA family protein disulfide reductase [Puniceicoccaceae bacterium]|nr:MAG: TlpA family protein disulfide reductase [Puniceicoccaceae bacterium]
MTEPRATAPSRPARRLPCLLVSFSCLLLAVPASAADWTPEAAVEELMTALAIPEGVDLRASPEIARQRRAAIAAWWEKYEASGIDLGEKAYLAAAPRYFLGGSEGRVEAVRWAAEHIQEHGGVTAHAANPAVIGFFGERIFPLVAGEALRAEDFELLAKAIPIAADHSSNPYSIYTYYGHELATRDAPGAAAVFHQLLARAMTDPRLDAAARQNLMRYIYGEPGQSGTMADGTSRIPFVTFEGPGLDGETIAVSDFQGKVLLIDFWATWCAPCLAEMPHVVAAHQKYRDQGFEVLGVSLDRANAHDRIRQVMQQYEMDWPQIYDGRGWQAEAAVMNNISAIPATVLLDRTGTPRFTNLRGDDVSRRVAELLAEEPIREERPVREAPMPLSPPRRGSPGS